MNARELERTLGDLTSTLGDPTRRAIYLMVQESAEPVTAAMVADRFNIHANVARHHLDRLAGEDYLEVTHKRPEGRKGPGAGRPAKCYTASDKEIELHYPTRRYDLLADLLIKVVHRLEPDGAAEAATEVGREYGLELARELGLSGADGFEAALATVQAAMTEVGFAVNALTESRQLHMSHCPFGRTAIEHPEVVCSLDRGIVMGLLAALDHASDTEVSPNAATGESCIATV